MKHLSAKIGFVLMILLIIHSCRKELVPVLETSEVINLSINSAVSGGIILDEGSGAVVTSGVCWSKDTIPTIEDSKTCDQITSGEFTSTLTGLDVATEYFVRAYATNKTGTGYGAEISFRTLGQTPLASVSVPTNVYATEATLNGLVNPNCLSTEVSFEYGLFPNYTNDIKISGSPITGDTAINVSVYVKDLSPNRAYQYRIKAVNSLGTNYSPRITFPTKGSAPTISCQGYTGLTNSSAIINAVMGQNFLSSTISFEYGVTSSYGNPGNWSGHSMNGYLFLGTQLTGLLPSTTYYYRYSAVNMLGTAYCIGYFKTLQ
jgi:hypothetical protein